MRHGAPDWPKNFIVASVVGHLAAILLNHPLHIRRRAQLRGRVEQAKGR
jgi:hypothetical protein